MSARKRITGEDVVLALKQRGLSTTAASLAELLGTDSRSVATAARQPVSDGRITIHYRRPATGKQRCGFYRFVRMRGKE